MAGAATQGQRDLKFVGSDPAGLPLKRKQVQHACEPCRKKKKRCTHNTEGAELPRLGQQHHDLDAIAASQLLHFSSHERISASQSQPGDITPHRSDDEAPTFIGDLNPESILIQAATADTDQSHIDSTVPGVWYRPRDQHSIPEPMAKAKKARKPKKENRSDKADSSLPEDLGAAFNDGDNQSVTSLDAADGVNGTSLAGATNHSSHANSSALGEHSAATRDAPKGPNSFDDACTCPLAKARVKDCPECLRRLIERASNHSVDSRAFDLLPKALLWWHIKDIYLTKIHPILPIFDATRLVKILDPQKAGLRRIDQLVVASVCHAVSFDPVSRSYLGIPVDTKATVHQTKLIGLATELAKLIDKRKHLFDYIRAMTLLCFFWQADSSNPQAPLDAFAEIVMLVQTHGLHLGRLRLWEIQKWVSKGFDNPPELSSFVTLFACIVSLDRLNAAYYGRPVLFNEHDLVSTKYLWGARSADISVPSQDAPLADELMAEDRPLSGPPTHTIPAHLMSAASILESQPPAFRLHMSIVFYLDQVIELYRPNPKWQEVTLPVFEHLVLDAGAENEPSPILATLEVLYHAVSILSVRMTHSLFQDSIETHDTTERRGQGSKHLPAPNLNVRRSLSADRIYWIVKTHALSAMPFIPYGLSLALSVAYRKWRFSRIAMFRSRGRATFTAVAAALALWGNFNFAYRNIKLANTVIRKMREVEERVKAGSSREATTNPVASTAGVDESRRSTQQPTNGVRPSSASHASQPHALDTSHMATDSPPPPRAASLGANAPEIWTPLFEGPTPNPPSYIYEAGTQGRDHSLVPTPQDTSQNYDPLLSVPASLLNDSSGFDVFNYVDKGSFPQDTVDFAFYSNLDPTCPSNGWLDFNPWDIDMELAPNMESDGWILKRW